MTSTADPRGSRRRSDALSCRSASVPLRCRSRPAAASGCGSARQARPWRARRCGTNRTRRCDRAPLRRAALLPLRPAPTPHHRDGYRAALLVRRALHSRARVRRRSRRRTSDRPPAASHARPRIHPCPPACRPPACDRATWSRPGYGRARARHRRCARRRGSIHDRAPVRAGIARA